MKENLALSLRPNNLNDFICDENLQIIFKSVIEQKLFKSFIFFGKPGTGKTSISYILAESLNVSYDYFNATVDNKEDLVSKLNNNQILIIDEIHRLNKDKQDILLPYVEKDLITIYGTTTENPYFKINPALRSRCLLVELEKPSIANIIQCLKNAIDKEYPNIAINNDILEFIASQAGGDYRSALNNLELIATLFSKKTLSLNEVKAIIPNIQFSSDKNQEAHYDYLSAFHKSLRGSDPNASLYYGLIILKSGDTDGLFRRMLCVAYEDIGLANPSIGVNTLTAIQAFERLGLPEGRLPIGFAILNLALSPKSNSAYLAINEVERDINDGLIYNVPNNIRDAHYASASKLNRGIDYKYPHDYPNHYVKQNYLPKQLLNKNYYIQTNQGWEDKINQYWEKIKGE
ncbi:ATPase [Metamycoplasma cloacale]|uniref:Replication-associated recombination protein A n=1 Tax=Metamycoplasma cloacale TaxID=92401 RepID=A0A2Z4LM01_9BACT|nr:replication-associated recombination protein A [Metamycoplasma cloacale]AWX42730.1 replication-associated recombination protein A [Metamycoplasma cloacale]VEU79458.1 ATPase [Metamycoplasma cloacale]